MRKGRVRYNREWVGLVLEKLKCGRFLKIK
jgi:hypothetical protein